LIREKTQHQGPETTYITGDKSDKRAEFFSQFREAMEDDLNFPKALAVLWSSAKSSITASDKLDLLYEFDEVFGLKLKEYCTKAQSSKLKAQSSEEIAEINNLLKKREELRSQKKFDEADLVRKEIEEKGWKVVDEKGTSKIVKKY
jgi:cysteinyl-tRNA synthetase